MPRINPELAQFFSGVGQKVLDLKSKFVGTTSNGESGFPILMLLLSFAILIGVFIWYGTYKTYFETEDNIKKIIKDKNDTIGVYYDSRRDKRINLQTYLDELKKSGVDENHLCLTNFYISTANATGIFLPGKDGVASEDAARVAVTAGARAFVFDIWPDLRPGGNFSPVLQIVESGSVWRRISLNSAPFVTVLKTIIHEIFERPGFTDDVVVLYLRFRGAPKRQTFDGTLTALQTCIEPYRLDASFNNCRGQKGDSNRLFSTFIKNLKKKVIVVSNNLAREHGLNDYINIGPDDGVKIEWSESDALGLNDQTRAKAIRDIQQNLAFVAPLSEDPKTDNNNWRFEESMKIGIQYIAMNFMQPPTKSEYIADYLDVKKFGRSSYLLKPVGLRYIPMFLSNPKSPENPGWGSGPTAGTPTVPPSIQMPST